MVFTVHSQKHGDFAIVIDDEDAERVMRYTWSVSYSNARKQVRAVCTYVDGKLVKIHNFVMRDKMIDHIDGDIFNNRKTNLRTCTNSQNLCNRGLQKNNTSGAKGVVWDKSRSLWAARIKKNRKMVNLGRFTNKGEAIDAYNQAALKYHKEFARLNEAPV